MLKIFFITVFLFFPVLAYSVTIPSDENELDNLMDGHTPIYIEFTDVIEGRYIVSVEWFPDSDLAPLFTGPASITFTLIDLDVEFTVQSELFSIAEDFFNYSGLKLSSEHIVNKNIFKIVFKDLIAAPFKFEDVNFDGVDELVIIESRGGQRWVNSFKTHLLQIDEEANYFNVIDISDIMPYKDFDDTTIFNKEDKILRLYYSGGACSSEYVFYEKVVNDELLVNYHFKKIKKEVYRYRDENDNNIGCHVYIYDVVDGEEILIEIAPQ